MASVARAALAQLLGRLSGLSPAVAYDWLGAENSSIPTNPLGILAGNSAGSGLETGRSGRFATYRSAVDGIRAAAWLLVHGPYGGIRSAAASGTPAQQRAAIIASPWAGGNYGHGAGFPTAGIPGAVATVTPAYTGTAHPSLPAATLASYSPTGWSSDMIARARAAIVSLGIDPSSTTHRLSYGEAETVATAVLQTGTRQGVVPLAAAITGQTPADLLAGSFNSDQSTVLNPKPPNPFDWSWIPGVMVNAGVLAVSVGLVLVGVHELLSPAVDAAEENPELLA